MKKLILLLILLSTFIYARVSYTVTIEPQKFFLERIGQSKVKVRTLYEGVDYTQKLDHVYFRKFAFSEAYLTIGLPVEQEYAKELLGFNSDLKVIDTSKDVEKLYDNGKINPYFWLDPLRVRKVTKVMLDILIKNDPSNKEFFQLNYQTLMVELDKIFLRLKDTLFYSTNAVMVFNDKLEYFLNRFDVRYYRAENEILSGPKFTEIYRLSKEKNIKYLIVDKSINYNVYNTWSNANNMEVIHTDIYSFNWFADLFVLSDKIASKKEE
ncbi:zinc ABC transporter substrate-binding protein [Arcobacter sp. KX21116]|jgi:zinc transport system substrate-binding protein|uniref:metal ABC transporter solute-binding protein, Zn/Mn family n=1 Tax=Arcobacter iocasae TaxID=2906515 RepID=UPI0035D49C6F|tara:strand:+ start:1370 stop:2170 length:801 start_codon:yes stop_codon:yes gene_type:complete